MIKTVLKTLVLVTAVGYLVFAVVKVSRPAGEMVCTGVEYQIADSDEVRLIDKAMIETLLARQKICPKGKIMDEIDTRRIVQVLSESPYIDTTHCHHTATGRLYIRVTPQHPLLHVFTESGEEFYVSRNGTVMPAGGLTADLPVVTGHVTRQYAVTRLLMLGKLLQEDEYWQKQTQQIHIDEKGNIEIIPRYSGQIIKLGEPRHIAEKLERVRLFYEKAMPKAGWNKYDIINVAYNNQIICKRKQK